ncbi:MAG: T9SS type A sorting domain-containing protein [Ignavibacteria bacterium]|nr:T9SS type A sorting domain-containing protein [Ignavibacteria bacterium]MBT8393159.1 T9SS type A sorting domain-containing protein [Ignavibacteria bacterium]NNL21285.1 T9SS type A sorting domain-containing protein [Ignavibacteriaceae bacterium]
MRIKSIIILSILFVLSSLCLSQDRIKIATYNILNYPNFANEKNPDFQRILNDINPDIITVQEILSQSAVNLFKDDVLGSEYSAATFVNGPDTDNALFYKDSLFTLNNVDFLPTSPRYITFYELYNNFTLDTLIIYVAHFKAGNSPQDEANRLNEASIFRIFSDMLPENSNFMFVGDLNLYRATEPAYEKLLNQSTQGYVLDPINRSGSWHNNSGYADIHTQSPRTAQLPDGGSNGGMDDRFDFILISQAVKDSGGIEYIEDTYFTYGNDGQHFNQQIINPPYPISLEIAFALHDVSDHLPVVAEFYFGKVSSVEPTDPSNLSFQLYQNYPNPFNPVTKIKFEVQNTTEAKLVLYDILGRKLKTLFEGEAEAGITEITLSADDLNSGVYFYSLITANQISSKKLIVLK